MKRIFKKIIPFLLAAFIALPVWAVTIQGLKGSSMQGGSAKMQGGSSFSPLNISTLIAWYDARQGITLNGPDDVSQWNDQSGNGNHLVQATAANQPLFIATDSGFNNKPVLDFDGATEKMAAAFAAGTTQPFSIIIVYNQGATNEAFPTLMMDTDGSRSPELSSFDDFNQIKIAAGSNFVATKTIPFTTPIVLSGLYNGSSSRIRADGISLATGSVGTDELTTAGITIFGNEGTGSNLGGKAAQILIYNKDLSNAEHNQLGNYLADIYGLTWTDIT